ncbi:MAG: DUF1822 family protein [Oscillatoria sp. SIO1A7]|nr:DUF1822 family protein [Oscillatoria sp. SIO1A7]
MLAFDQIVEQFSGQICFDIYPEDWEAATPASDRSSNEFARHNTLLNRLVANKLIPWFRQEDDIEAKLWPSSEALGTIWEFVNGTAITFGDSRAVIVPSETIDIEELRVPREWIDIPDWVANYYIAVQVQAELGWLRIWGYATHKQLKTEGIYDPITETYALGREDIIEDLDVIWFARELCPDETVTVEPLPTLSAQRIESLLPQLSQPFSFSPRLEVEFEQWAALLANSSNVARLYQLRLNSRATATSIAAAAIAGAFKETFTRLSDFKENLEQNISSGWKTIDELLAVDNKVAWSFRLTQRSLISDPLEPEAIRELIDRIYNSSNEHRRKQAAEKLADVRTKNEEVIQALVYLTRNSKHEETRWAAAESLWAIDPGNSVAEIRRIKDLGMLLSGHPVALMAAMLEKDNGKIAILLRVYPMRGLIYLPPGLQLTVLDEEGNFFLDAEAREADNYIQLKFSGDRGELFSARVSIGEGEIIEDFVI